MRRAIQEADSAKVLVGYETYQTLTEKATEMGADLDKFPSSVPDLVDKVVKILKHDSNAGYTLVEDKDGNQYLLADEHLERQRPDGEITYLIVFPNGSMEEYDTQEQAEKRYKDNIIKGNFKMTDKAIVYTITSKKELKASLSTSFE